MPGVTALPSSPSLSSFPSSTANVFTQSHTDAMTVAEIKSKANNDVLKVSRGASALTLLKGARTQLALADQCERDASLKEALRALHNAAALTRLFLEHNEVKMEIGGKHGVLMKEFKDYEKNEGHDLPGRLAALEKKLMELEKLSTTTNGSTSKSPSDPDTKPGGSIADRMRALQDSGMALGAAKRFSRESASGSPSNRPSTPPISNIPPNRSSLGQELSPKISTLSPASGSNSMTPSPHEIIPASSFGPPSPSSTPASSPRGSVSQFTFSDFSTTFPPIDELEDLQIGSGNSTKPVPDPSSPSTSRSFPVLPIDPGPRPSSTPITPITNTFVSRPSSPTVSSPPPPTHLATPSISAATEFDVRSLPVSNTILPKPLHDYIEAGVNVLLLDVRTRAEFDKEHVKAGGGAIVCLEPSVLMRENVSAQGLEDALIVGPREERALFQNREKFDLVALIDSSSTSYTPSSPLSTLFSIIYEKAFTKYLKHMPVLVVGGLEAWKRDVGDASIIRNGAVDVKEKGQGMPKIRGGSENPFRNGMVISGSFSPVLPSDPHQLWTPPARADTSPDLSRSTTAAGVTLMNGYHSPDSAPLMHRQASSSLVNGISSPPTFTRSISDNANIPSPSSSIQYPHVSSSAHAGSTSSFTSSSGAFSPVSFPPVASLNQSLSRRRNDFVDQSQEALSGINTRSSIDYPDLSAQHILRPPPPVASSALERNDNRPRLTHGNHSFTDGPQPPRIQSYYPVTYWPDAQIGYSGLKNLGNTCYMNSTIQCLSATVPFARFFTEGRWRSAINMVNPMGTRGVLARAFSEILHDLWQAEVPYISPIKFRQTISAYAAQFRGSDQHDSQEFLSFLLDGLHEDLNRCVHKPPVESDPDREAELEKLPQQIASEKEWGLYMMRNDSLIVDFFQGQFRNRMECLTCHKTSTTYNSFMYLTLPVPTGRGSTKIPIQQCLDAFVKEEVMEKTDAWHCPNCKGLRRATKKLSLSRLPPVLLIHLKRFSFKGPFTDKIETFVDFPLNGLDLTNYMPPPLPPGLKTQLNGGQPASTQDPRSQLPPYKYDLYAVTNHFGSLSSGHYTASISTRGGWAYCDDSSIRKTNAREVVGRPAYVLFYKRAKS